MERCLSPAEERLARPLRLLDLGAGNGWLSYHLARRGHEAAAVDLTVNDFDGLGAHVHFDAPFTPVQAEFDHLPFAGVRRTWPSTTRPFTTRPITLEPSRRRCGFDGPAAR